MYLWRQLATEQRGLRFYFCKLFVFYCSSCSFEHFRRKAIGSAKHRPIGILMGGKTKAGDISCRLGMLFREYGKKWHTQYRRDKLHSPDLTFFRVLTKLADRNVLHLREHHTYLKQRIKKYYINLNNSTLSEERSQK